MIRLLAYIVTGGFLAICAVGAVGFARLVLAEFRERRAAKAVVLQAETATYLAALARLQREQENR